MTENIWLVKKERLIEIVNNPNFHRNSLEFIKENESLTLSLIGEANRLYQDGNFGEAAKIFRQLARSTKNLEHRCETKGLYDDRNTLNDLTGKEWLRHTKSWLVVDGIPTDIVYDIKNHPASFPPDLATHFIEFFSKKGDWIFDPFMGIGSVLKSAYDLQRNCWGIELNKKYQEFTLKRIQYPLKSKYRYIITQDDARDAYKLWNTLTLPKMKFLITSPPYWDILGKSRGGVKSTLKQRVENGLDEKYSNNPLDLGNISELKRYFLELKQIFVSIKPILATNAYLVVILQNVRTKEGEMEPIAWEFAHIMKDIYKLRQEYVWCQDQKFMGIWGYPKTYVSNVHHHYCLVFQNN